MKIWKNTSTLDGYDNGLQFTDSKNDAIIALLGSKSININDFPMLKAIFRAGIGKDNVPEYQARERGIKVCYPSKDTSNIIFQETAHFVCATIMKMLYDNIGTINPWVKFPRKQLVKKTLLIIGLGKIGTLVNDLMKQFMIVDTFDIINNKPIELKSLVNRADCITIHIPNSKDNKNFIDQEKLSWMKDGSILINTSRGEIVNENALYEELTTFRIKAAFDVFWEEPYTGKLSNLHPNSFYMTPHLASTCEDFLQGCRKDLDNLISEIR